MNRVRRPLAAFTVAVLLQTATAHGQAKKKAAELPADVFAPAPKAKAAKAKKFQRAAAPPPPAAVLDPIVAQYLPQFRQITRTEIGFVEKVCALSKDQKRELAAEADKACRDAAKGYAAFQNKMMQGQWNANDTMPDPRQLVEESLAPALASRLTADQLAKYKGEVRKRNDHRKEVAILTLVAKLDEELVLTADQREKLRDSLSKNWKPTWGQSIEMLLYEGNQAFPQIPDQYVTPILNRTQKEVWQGFPKYGGYSWGNNFGLGIDGGGNEAIVIEGGEAMVIGVEAAVVEVKAVGAVQDKPEPKP